MLLRIQSRILIFFWAIKLFGAFQQRKQLVSNVKYNKLAPSIGNSHLLENTVFSSTGYLYRKQRQSSNRECNMVLSLTSTNINIRNIFSTVRQNWKNSCEDIKVRPWTYISIPIVAALVGYVTNWLGVKMLFYPIDWFGIPIKRIPGQPLGILGWQGIVPAKRVAMASKMVDVTISQLLKISEVFGVLKPRVMARLLAPTVGPTVLGKSYFHPNPN